MRYVDVVDIFMLWESMIGYIRFGCSNNDFVGDWNVGWKLLYFFYCKCGDV